MSSHSKVRHAMKHPLAEWTLFAVAAGVGMYSLGQGLGNLYGEHGNVLWLLVTGAALIVLCAQMGRMHDVIARGNRSDSLTRSTEADAAAMAERNV